MTVRTRSHSCGFSLAYVCIPAGYRALVEENVRATVRNVVQSAAIQGVSVFPCFHPLFSSLLAFTTETSDPELEPQLRSQNRCVRSRPRVRHYNG
jgi:hypothetical protein